MAKLKGPLLSLSASGTFGPRMTFSMRKTGSQVRIQNKQKDKISVLQSKVRGLYSLAVFGWNNLTQNKKDIYIELAKTKNMSGYNYFIKVAIANPFLYLNVTGYYDFNELSGSVCYDQSGRNANINLLPTFPTNCPLRVPSTIKKAGMALSFDGVDDQARTNSALLESRSGSVAIIITPIVKQTSGYFLSSVNVDINRFYFFFNNNTVFVTRGNNEPKNAFPLPVGTRGKIIITWDDSKFYCYLNGVKRSEYTYTQLNTNGTVLNLGYQSISSPFRGITEKLIIFNKTLSPSEVFQLNKKCP